MSRSPRACEYMDEAEIVVENKKNCGEEMNKKYRMMKRTVSFETEQGINQKSFAVRSITTTQDNSECHDFESSLLSKNRSNQLHIQELKA